MADKLEILNHLKSNLEDYLGENLKEVVLFGSHVSGIPTVDSDYDFLIILKNKPDWKLKNTISDICYKTDLQFGIITDTHILSVDDQGSLRGKQPIFVNALNRGIHA
jgi:predicted nucleotidyltransferase